jgi:hypothetical protein
LRSGSVLEGQVSREGGKIVVQLEGGSIRLEAVSVARIERAETPLARITRLRAALAEGDLPARLRLANLCQEARLSRCERELLAEIVARARSRRGAPPPRLRAHRGRVEEFAPLRAIFRECDFLLQSRACAHSTEASYAHAGRKS